MTPRPDLRTPSSSFLVEGFWPSAGGDTFRKATARLDARLEALRREGTGFRLVAATLVPGDEAAYWIVDAPSMEVVATALTEAGIRADRIVGALELRAGQAVGPGRAPVATR